jgi:F420-non-reducing hydrogenase small subunit
MPKMIITSLTGCSGCISSLMASEIFPHLLERVDIISFPFIYDKNEIENCDIALIEGCVSESTQISYLKEIRTHAKKIISLGTCAVSGGIQSLSKNKNINAISDIIEIDGIIPGCPPPSKLMGTNLMRLFENKSIVLSSKNLCYNCPLNKSLNNNSNNIINKINLSLDKRERNKKKICFLQRGRLCFGLITREGCDHVCINNDIPCEGCLGPVSRHFASNLVNLLSVLEISKEIELDKNVFFRFSKPKI